MVIVSSCVSEKGKSEREQNLEKGKYYLSHGDYVFALEYFDKILKENPHDGEALIGSSISQFFALTLDIANYIASVAGINRSEGIPSGGFNIMGGTKTEKQDIFQVIKDLLGGLLVRLEKMDSTFNLAEEYGTSLKVSHVPLMWNMKTVLDFGGKIDRTDIYFLSMLSKLFLGSIKFLLSQQLDMDIFEAYAQYNHLKETHIAGTTIPKALMIMNIIVEQLNDPEVNLLNLSKWDLDSDNRDDGEEFYTEFPNYITGAYEDLMNLFKYGEKEPLAPDEVVEVINADKAASLPEDDSARTLFNNNEVTYVVRLDKRVYVHGNTITVDLYFDKDGLDALKRIVDQIKGIRKDRVNLVNDILPVFSDVVASLLKIISDTKLIKLPSFLNGLMSLGSISPSMIYQFIVSFVPDIFEFDFHAFFSTPVSFRTLLPPWRNDLDKDENMFFLEWDTDQGYEPGRMEQYLSFLGPWGLVLPQSIPPVDSYHFSSPIYHAPEYRSLNIHTIAPDQVASPLPYISFRNNDASFNKLLYLCFGNDPVKINPTINLGIYYGLSATSTDYPKEFSPATARDFNAVIAYFYGKYKNTFDSLLYGNK